MLNSLLNALFGCSHKRTTFPLTPSRRPALSANATRRATYVVCLDCGKEFDYNWKEMRIGAAAMTPAPVGSLTPINH
jgi:predicted transcriptional regulator